MQKYHMTERTHVPRRPCFLYRQKCEAFWKGFPSSFIQQWPQTNENLIVFVVVAGVQYK